MSKSWNKAVDTAVAARRALHRRPELTWAEHETAATIRGWLDALDIPWRVCASTGTLGQLAADAPGRHIALRADIDALPIVEDSGVAWSSETPGCMDACGHDGHTATLYAAAMWLKRHESRLPGPVTLLFQPAEEGGHGAEAMIADGALEGIDCIFGWHNWPAIPFGHAVCPDDAVMAGNGTFEIVVRGCGGHASQPELCRDPVLAASAIVVALQQAVSRRIAPQAPAVISVTRFKAEAADTVIPDIATLGGSFRLGRPELREQINGLIEGIATSTATAYGVEAHINIERRYDATVNHAAQAGEYRHALKTELGQGWQDENLALPIMPSEAIRYYLQEIPGAFALVGADDGRGHHHPCHSAHYDFNDRLIDSVGRIYARLAGVPVES